MERIRTAIYFTPAAAHPLTEAAARWLGRDAHAGPVAEGPPLGELDPAAWARLTAAPRRYGFHATLKAPFVLAPGTSVAELDTALEAWCRERPPVDLPPLVLSRLGRFYALVPEARSPAVDALAAAVVRDFEPFRAPLDEAEFKRRTAAHLTPPQVENVRRWGYSYVFDDFRFHMTLTGPVPEAECAAVEAALRRQFAAFLGSPLRIDALSLFLEPRLNGDFTVVSRHPLGHHSGHP